MKEEKNFKTLKEILNGATEKRFYNRTPYALQIGLTLCVERLSKEFGGRFVLLSAAPKKAIRYLQDWRGNQTIEEDTEKAVLGNYVAFLIDKKYYYYQFDLHNPLFEDYFAAVELDENGNIPPYYLDTIGRHFYGDCELYVNDKSKKYFESVANSFYNSFKEIFGHNSKDNDPTRRHHVKKVEQTFYYKY